MRETKYPRWSTWEYCDSPNKQNIEIRVCLKKDKHNLTIIVAKIFPDYLEQNFKTALKIARLRAKVVLKCLKEI